VEVVMAGQSGDASLYTKAESHLDRARRAEHRSSSMHRIYATLYGKQGKEGAARYHLAEEAALQGRMDEANALLADALTKLPKGDKKYREAMDFKAWLDAQPKDKDKR